MPRLHQRGGSVLPTSASASLTCPACETPASTSALRVIVAALERTLGSDARTDRALRLLRPVLFAGVLTVLGVTFICIAVSSTGTWWSLVSGVGLAVASAGTAIVRRAIGRRRRSRNQSPGVDDATNAPRHSYDAPGRA
jgi:hypothetical protein